MQRRREVFYEGDPLRVRLARFTALLGIVFVVTVAVIVTQRLSNDALALIIGILLAGCPLLIIVGVLAWFLVRRDQRQIRQASQAQSPAMMPPIIVQVPNALPAPTSTPTPAPWMAQQPTQRQFTIVGEE